MKMALRDLEYLVFDLETTGLYADEGDQIIEIGAVLIRDLQIVEKGFQTLVNPGIPIPEASTAVHGISDEQVEDAPKVEAALRDFFKFAEGKTWVAQNARFDMSFVLRDMKRLGVPLRQATVIDTIGISKILFPYETRHNLDVLMARMGIAKTGDRHRSLDDSRFTAKVLIEFIKLLEKQGMNNLMDIQDSFLKLDSIGRPKKPKSMGLFA